MVLKLFRNCSKTQSRFQEASSNVFLNLLKGLMLFESILIHRNWQKSMSFSGFGDDFPAMEDPDDDFPREVVQQVADLVASPEPIPDTPPETAVPSVAFSLFLEIVKRHIPPDKQQLFVASRGAPSIEAALSVDYVCGLALEEIQARVAAGSAGR
jgi:hypothetical protein